MENTNQFNLFFGVGFICIGILSVVFKFSGNEFVNDYNFYGKDAQILGFGEVIVGIIFIYFYFKFKNKKES